MIDKFKLYITDMGPNGTRDLIIAKDNKMVGVISEAVFGNIIGREFASSVMSGNEIFILGNGWIGTIGPNDPEYFEVFEVPECGIQQIVEVTFGEIINHIAVSPTQSVFDVIADIVDIVRMN